MIASAVREILAEAGRGAKETNLFVGRMPSSPPGATAVFVAPGGVSERGLCPTPIASNVAGQVQIRRETYAAAEEEAERVFNVLDALVVPKSISGFATIIDLTPSSPFMLRRDAGEFPVFAVNFSAIREPEVL